MAYIYRGPQSPRDEPQVPVYSNPLSPQRNPNRLSGGMTTTMSPQDVRGGLTRRFTTNALPTLSPIGQQRMQAAGDHTASGYARKLLPSESQFQRYENLLAVQRKLQAELEAFDPSIRREVENGLRHEESIAQMMASSEPASPPEYGNAFPTSFSKPNRYSATGLTSPPGITTRPNRSSTQLTSPAAAFVRPFTSSGHAPNIPSQSMPGSRRQSDDEDDDNFIWGYDSALHRAAANPNRNSMPITGYDRKRNPADISSVLGPVNTTSFLFDDDDEKPSALHSKSSTTSPPDTKTYLQVQHTADGFPKLIRRGDDSDTAALDLALSRGVDPEQQVTERATASRHRISLPPTALSGNIGIAPLNSILANADGKPTANNRRSLEVKFSAETKRPALIATPPRPGVNGMMQKPLSSYSTNDIPTLKSINSITSRESSGGVSVTSPTHSVKIADPTSPEDSTAALNRATSASASSNINRRSQDFAFAMKPEDISDTFSQSGLQANATPFGPMPSQDSPMQNFGQNPVSPYAQPPYYNGYGMQMLNNGFNGMNMNGGYGGQGQWPNQLNMYQQGGYSSYQQFPQGSHAVAGAGRFGDNQRMTMQQRRQAQEEAQAKYNSINIEELSGEIYGLCKDQHGCRFLQRKLDERNEKVVQTIFDEVKSHIIELMTDPFGNYLCQKLLESTNDEQRTVLVQNAMPAMTKIALNQHGTRALQKMIEFISTLEQTNMVIEALRFDVVQLIQDLNGNHVIQKCLNHLSPENAQFIFDAVGANCITVGTHRHGCCVLQRCIDHASGLQKGGLVDRVIENAFTLVQDPFGNYVVQYILDLAEPCFTEPLCRSFLGNIVFLSKQKFSSNVIEKCIRCAGDETKRLLVHEIAVPHDLEKLLRDSFANYVVQTAMDFSDEETKALLIDNVRPILPSIRHTPYGRRIQSKITDYDGRSSGLPSGAVTPADVTTSPSGNLPYAAVQSAPVGRGNRQGWIGPPPQFGSNNGFGAGTFGNDNFGPNGTNHRSAAGRNNPDIASPTPQRHSHSNSLFGADAQNFQNHAFGSPSFAGMGRQAPPYGHF